MPNDTERFDVSDMAAMLNGHEITDDGGNLTEETESAPEETVTEEIVEEQPVEETTKAPEVPTQKAPVDDDLVEDESTGKKYVPEKRFTEVYAKMKELERKLQVTPGVIPQPVRPSVPLDRADALETELLYSTMPEFDPNSTNYDRRLDELAFQYYRPEQGVTKIAAARKAKDFIRQLSQSQDIVKKEARTVKIAQSEGSIAKRSQAKDIKEADPSRMSLTDKEEYLKAQGLW